MLSMLRQRLQIYCYSDASPDNNVDTPIYTYQTTAWGRIEPKGGASDKTIGAASTPESNAYILFRDSVPVGAGSLVVDPITKDQWRIAGNGDRLQALRLIRYTADSAPQFTLTAPIGTAS